MKKMVIVSPLCKGCPHLTIFYNGIAVWLVYKLNQSSFDLVLWSANYCVKMGLS